MSFDLAVWDGKRPESEDAEAQFAELLDAYEEQLESDVYLPPSPRLGAFLSALVHKLPDDPSIDPPRNPWAFMPLQDEAQGPLAILHVLWDHVGPVLEVVPPLAREHGLVCYDLQQGALL